MKDLYLTSTFTNPWNVSFNSKIGEALEQKGFSCYLPHRDTDQQAPGKEKFNADIKGIQNASMVFAIALNASPNFGAEVGFAYGVGKPVLALTDKTHAVPLICEGMMEVFRVDDLDAIDQYIDSLSEKIKQIMQSRNS